MYTLCTVLSGHLGKAYYCMSTDITYYLDFKTVYLFSSTTQMHIFIPISIEPLGPIYICTKATQFLCLQGNCLRAASADAPETAFLFQLLPIMMQWFSTCMQCTFIKNYFGCREEDSNKLTVYDDLITCICINPLMN